MIDWIPIWGLGSWRITAVFCSLIIILLIEIYNLNGNNDKTFKFNYLIHSEVILLEIASSNLQNIHHHNNIKTNYLEFIH